MNALMEVLPLVIVGVAFTTVGALKVYGRTKGIVGGGGRPVKFRLLGSCPTWTRKVNIAMTWLFCAIGIAALGAAVVTILKQ